MNAREYAINIMKNIEIEKIHSTRMGVIVQRNYFSQMQHFYNMDFDVELETRLNKVNKHIKEKRESVVNQL